MNKFLIGGAALAAFAGAGIAVAQTAPHAPGAAHQRHMKTSTRADVQTRIQQMFQRVDADRDGFITRAEADAMKAQRAGKRQQRMEQRAQHNPGKRFDRLDANRDGQVTRAEATAAQQARAARQAQNGGNRLERLFARADSNRDGAITRAEFDAMPKGQGRGMRGARAGGGIAGRMFERADGNKDGRVSLPEAQGAALSHFDRFDLDRDGTLTPQERKQAREQFRAQRRG